MAYCKNCINAVESNLSEGGLYCTMFRSPCGDTIGCSNGVDGKRKAKTNADRIRAMTDAELAEYLARVDKYENYAFDWLYWLQQEAEE